MAYHLVKPYTVDDAVSAVLAARPEKTEDEGESEIAGSKAATPPQDTDPREHLVRRSADGHFLPGQSGNPAGTVKRHNSLAEQVRTILREPASKGSKLTHMHVILAMAVKQAKDGNYRAREFLANRGFGMAEQRIKQDVTKTEVIVLE